MDDRDVLITGIGLVSSLGTGTEANWDAVCDPAAKPFVDSERYAPYTVHPLPEIDWSEQIPKRGDQRQMEPWQRIGTFAAGLALDDAGFKDDEAGLASMDMIIAAGGGERDAGVDSQVLNEAFARNDREVLLNEKITTELRPTLFLAQLSNLLAGNISIVHKVTGSSRTFMGEEPSGIAALQTAAARIRSGSADHMLVGSSYNADHPDMLLGYALGGYLHTGGWTPLAERSAEHGGGVVTGSGGAVLILESRAHAEKRGRKAYALIDAVASDRAPRTDAAAFTKRLDELVDKAGGKDASYALSGASGAHDATAAERAALQTAGIDALSHTALTGHMRETHFLYTVALAALSLHNQATPQGLEPFGTWQQPRDIDAILATSVGFHRGEGAALLAKV